MDSDVGAGPGLVADLSLSCSFPACTSALCFLFLAIFTIPFLYDRHNSFAYYSKFMCYYVYCSTFACLCIPGFLLNPKSVKNCYYMSFVLKQVTKVVGVEWELRGAEHLAEEKGSCVVANHQSTFDILGMFNIWDVLGNCATIAKKEVFWVWPFGLAAWLGGVVFIDRSSPSKSYKQLEFTTALAQREKTKIWFFPEGTRNWDSNRTRQLLPFKKGAFKIAVLGQLPVIPVVYSPYYFMNPRTHYFGQGKIIVEALPAISTEGLTEADVEDLMNRTRDQMAAKYEELFSEIVAKLPDNHPGFVEH